MRVIATTYNNGPKDNDRDIFIKIAAKRSLMNRFIRVLKIVDRSAGISTIEKWLYKIFPAVIVLSQIAP